MSKLLESSSVAISDQMVACDVAVIELLGPDEAEATAEYLKQDAQSEPGVTVRVVFRGAVAEDLPHRRRRAANCAEGAVAFLIEDTTALQEGWARALRDVFADPSVAAACGPVRVAPELPSRFRALGRLEYGRFDGTNAMPLLPGNAFAIRLADLDLTHETGEGIIEHDLESRLLAAGRKISCVTALTAVYAEPDVRGARLTTRFAHGRLYGAGRVGNPFIGILKAGTAMPVLTVRALRAARIAGPARQWLPELPWIIAMATAWALGELTGQIAGEGNSQRSWS